MGTRGLTMVIHKREVKVAQYGQWDHYPSGQGRIMWSYLNENGIEKLKEGLEKCRFIVEGSRKDKEINGMENWKEKYPQLSRDVGGGILEMIAENQEDIFWLSDQREFRNDNIFCEYTYIIDLDKNEFQIFQGGYNPLIAFKLNELPDTEFNYLQQVKEACKVSE